jgi:hypothetical protein
MNATIYFFERELYLVTATDRAEVRAGKRRPAGVIGLGLVGVRVNPAACIVTEVYFRYGLPD